jgi:soluble cytochrome b562
MGRIGKAFRALGKQVNDASKNEESLKLVATIKSEAELAENLKPAKTASVPADQQDKFIADYQADMKSFVADVDSLEAALKAGNNAEAAQLVDKMKKDMQSGHKQYQKQKKKQ